MDGISYVITPEPEDMPVRGNAVASGDDAYDRRVEDGIIARLESGDDWAWCCVRVDAHLGGLTGTAYLGGCSYADEAGFRRGGYYESMCAIAKSELVRLLADARDAAEALGI